ncbi:MAG: DUF4388 domain-containing protein [Thermoanaerobaculia bacterium]
MNLEGEIWELELIPRLIELGSQAFTGALRFENDSVIKIVYFKEGSILSASTNDRADSIDEILLRSGKVTRDHVKQALSKRKETETLGDALLGLGFIAKRELAWARRVQLIGILRSIGEWQAGSFTIVADYLPKREEGTAFSLPQIVLELILTDQDRSKYDKALESGSAVFRKSESFQGTFSSLGLNQEAETITSSIDGVRTAAEIASESGSDAFNVYKLLNALNLLGLVEKRENLLEVVAPVVPPAFEAFDTAPESTVEMGLDFGGAAQGMDLGGGFPTPDSSADFDGEPRLDSGSSVPPAELDSYEYQAPVADELPEDGLGSAEVEGGAHADFGAPSSADSEGLGSIEALRNFELPAVEVPPIEERIAEKQATKRPFSPPPAPRAGKTGLIAGVAIGVIAIVAVGGWYYLRSRPVEDPVAVAAKGPQPTPAVSETSTQTETSTEPTQTTTSASSTLPETVSVPSTAEESPVKATATAPPPAAAATRAPEAKAPTPSPATQQPKATTPAPVPAPSGKYAGQAQQYAKEAATVPFTVQFALVCRDASIENNVRIGGSKIWYVPITYRGESCYKVYWGRYTSRDEAERGVAEIPASLRGGKPSVVSPGSGSQ